MNRKQRIVLLAAFAAVGAGAAVGIVAALPEGECAMPSPTAGTTLVAADDFEQTGGAEGAGRPEWHELRSDPGVSLKREGGVLSVGGTVTRFVREPDGLRTGHLGLTDFDVRVRVKLVESTGTGAKEAFIEARSKVGARFRVYMSPKSDLGGDEDAEGEKGNGHFAAYRGDSGSSTPSDTERTAGYTDLDVNRHIMRLTYEAASGRARAYVDARLIKEYTLKMSRPAFTIGIESPDEGSSFRAAFDDFELHGRKGE